MAGTLRNQRHQTDVLVLLLIVAVAVVAAFPLIWMVLSSFKTPARLQPCWKTVSPSPSAAPKRG